MTKSKELMDEFLFKALTPFTPWKHKHSTRRQRTYVWLWFQLNSQRVSPGWFPVEYYCQWPIISYSKQVRTVNQTVLKAKRTPFRPLTRYIKTAYNSQIPSSLWQMAKQVPSPFEQVYSGKFWVLKMTIWFWAMHSSHNGKENLSIFVPHNP